MATHEETLDAPAARTDAWRRAALLLTAALFPLGMATLGAVLLLAAILAGAARRTISLWQRTVLDPVLVVLLVVFALSALWSPFRAMALEATVLFALLLVLAYGTTAVLVSRSPGVLSRLIWAIGAGSAAAGGWGIAAYFLTGQPAYTPGVGSNAVGTTLATGLPLLLAAGVAARGRLRVAAAAGAAVTLTGLALTFTRGAWLGGAVGVVLFVALLPRQALRPVLLLLLVVLTAGVLGLTGAAGALRERAETLSDPASASDRVAMWRSAVAMVRDRPLLGSGLNTFGLLYPQYRRPEDPSLGQPFAHNLFLNIAAEGGLAGLAAFVVLLAVAAGLGLRWLRRADGLERVRAAGVLAAAAAMLTHQQLDGTAISFHIGFGLWMLLGIIAARATASGAH